MTTTSPLSQTLSTAILVGATLASTSLRAQEPIDILAATIVPMSARVSGSPYAPAATRDTISDSGILVIARDLIRSNSRWYSYVGRRLAELTEGKHASSGMPVPTRIVTERALAVAMEHFDIDTPTPSVVPSEEGNVLFVWRSEMLELEIEIGLKESTVWAYDRSRGEVWSGALAEQQESVSRWLASLDQQ
jgi:hypothetical protein